MAALGLDIGTQSAKAVILGDDLDVLGTGSSGYQPSLPQPGWAEQDPGQWLAAVGPAIAAALADAGLQPREISSIAVCGQLDGCVPVDHAGTALAPAIIWMDRRGAPLLEGIDADLVHARTGLVLDATHMGGKVAWFDRQLRQRGDVASWHQPVSFVVEALTGRRVMSRSLASTTMLYGVASREWDAELMALFGARATEMPELAEEADIAGALTRRGAEVTGLPMGIPVAVGTGDDFSNPLGCGICRPGIVGVSLGTAETVGALSQRLLIDETRLVETHAYPGGLYHLGNPGWLSGGAVRWAAGLLEAGSDEAFSALAAKAPPGCEGAIFIPALSGAMAPKWIAAARGGFLGLTQRHGPAHMARAVLEGTAYAMRDVVDRLAAIGVGTERLRLMGGGARSDVWCQIRTAVSGRPIDVLAEADASAVGAALLALVAEGRMADVATASGALRLKMVEISPVHDERYEQGYRSYRAAFAALEPIWLEQG